MVECTMPSGSVCGVQTIIVDRLGEGLARGVELEDGDDFARLRLLDQVVIVKAPGRRGVGAEAAPGMAGVAARARPHVEDAHFQDIAGLGVLDRNRAGQQMHADAFAGAAHERTFGRPRAAARHGFVFLGPVEHAFGAGIVRDHALVIVIGVMGQRFDGGAVAGLQRQRRRDLLAEIAPLDVGGRNGEEMMFHAIGLGCTRMELVGTVRRSAHYAGATSGLSRFHHVEEARGDGVARAGEHLVRRPFLDDRAAAEEHHAVGDFVGEAQLMGRDDHGQAVLDREPPDHFQHFVDQFRIERRGRLVEQQHARIGRERARDRDALLLAAGQMPRQGVGALAEADAFEQFARAAVGIGARHAVHPAQRPGDVLQRGQMAEQVELLEHHADADAGALVGERARRQRLAVLAKAHAAAADLDDAGVPAFEMVDAAQQRALARAAGAEQRDDFADPHGEIDAGEHRLLGVGLVQSVDLDRDIVARQRRRALVAVGARCFGVAGRR